MSTGQREPGDENTRPTGAGMATHLEISSPTPRSISGAVQRSDRADRPTMAICLQSGPVGPPGRKRLGEGGRQTVSGRSRETGETKGDQMKRLGNIMASPWQSKLDKTIIIVCLSVGAIALVTEHVLKGMS